MLIARPDENASCVGTLACHIIKGATLRPPSTVLRLGGYTVYSMAYPGVESMPALGYGVQVELPINSDP